MKSLRPPWPLMLVAFLLFGCGTGETPRRFVVALPSGPSSLFPNAANDGPTQSALSNVYETLVDVDANLALRPGLAESWHTPDDLSWVFSLREGVRLHDGRVLEARDVAQSLEHARADPSSRRRAQLAGIRSIEAIDRRTIVVRTDRPMDTLPARLSNVFVWARPVRLGDPGVGTGPYRVHSRTAGGGIVLESFPGHRLGAPAIPLVEFRVIPGPVERIRQLIKGEAHLAVEIPATQIRFLGLQPGLRVVSRNGFRVLFLGMDSGRRKTPYVDSRANPFRDRRVRQAMALALNRNALVEGPLKGFVEVLDQITSPQELGAFKDSILTRPASPAAARRLLEAAGYARGFQVHLDFPESPDTGIIARALAGDLGRIGIRVVLRSAPEPEVMRKIETRDTSLYILSWIGDTGDGRVSYEYVLHSPVGGLGLDNGGGYSDPWMDRLIRQACAPLPAEERSWILARLAAKVALDVPIIPLFRTADLYGVVGSLDFEPRLDGRIRIAEIRWSRVPSGSGSPSPEAARLRLGETAARAERSVP